MKTKSSALKIQAAEAMVEIAAALEFYGQAEDAAEDAYRAGVRGEHLMPDIAAAHDALDRAREILVDMQNNLPIPYTIAAKKI